MLRTGVHACYRWASESPEPLQQPPASQEEAEVAHSVYQPPDLRAGEAIPVPEVSVACRPGRDRGSTGPQQRAGHHVVPKQTRKAQARHGGAQEGRRVNQDTHSSQVLPRKRTGPRYPKEKILGTFCNGS